MTVKGCYGSFGMRKRESTFGGGMGVEVEATSPYGAPGELEREGGEIDAEKTGLILMGQLAFNSSISRRLYDTAHTYLGGIRGGLAMATVSACTAFGAICGSSPATAATMAIVYGILTEESIGKLFVAGILPAIVVTV